MRLLDLLRIEESSSNADWPEPHQELKWAAIFITMFIHTYILPAMFLQDK